MFLPHLLLQIKALAELPPAFERFLARRPQGRGFPGLFCYPRQWVLYRVQELQAGGAPHLVPFARNEQGRELAVRVDTGKVCWTDSPDRPLHPSFTAFLEAEGERARIAKKRVPLIEAARRGDLDKIRRLIRRGDDIDFLNHQELTPLMAALLNWQFEAAALLLDHGPDLNRANRGGDTALMFAALRNQPALVARMLALGADPCAVTHSGEPVLLFALTGPYELAQQKPWGSLEVAQLLVAAGANPAQRVRGRMLWEAAPAETDPAIIDWLRAAAGSGGC